MSGRMQDDCSTRKRILRLVVEEGPVSVLELACDLSLTAAGVRRHVAALEESGQIIVRDLPHLEPCRGRPARHYVATELGQAALDSSYADLAGDVLGFVAETVGEHAVMAYAEQRADLVERRLGAAMAPGDGLLERAERLADALSMEGYAASIRPVPGGRAVQLCQGHCPVQEVAARFPELCEAEARMFSRLLDVHVQRLSTLASGGHVCTTHVPVGAVGVPVPTGSVSRGNTAEEGDR
jgi:predicted ArsR family transcriptional regulator